VNAKSKPKNKQLPTNPTTAKKKKILRKIPPLLGRIVGGIALLCTIFCSYDYFFFGISVDIEPSIDTQNALSSPLHRK
jgi:hypothetical protein